MLRTRLYQSTFFAAAVVGLFATAGCRHPGHCSSGSCSNGSCHAPSAGHAASSYSDAPVYGQPSHQGSGTRQAVPNYPSPTPSYSAPSGSGSRNAPMSGGSGTR